MFEQEARLQVELWVEAQLKLLPDQGVYYYIHQRGEKHSGIILLKLNGLEGRCRLLIQQRNFDGKLGWMNAMNDELVEEKIADEYIKRSVLRDPDLWVIEIEDKNMNNPFEGDMVEF
tara:strand:- start:1863 stop:2213 length:351 start_codon:yes stop_codon:yes gene_type:complete